MKKLLLVSALTLFSTSIYSQSSVKVYTSGGDYVQITITGVNLVVTPTGGDCTFTRAEIDYDISSHNSSGTVISPITLYTLNGRIKCDNSNMSFSLPKSGGIGTASSASSGGHSFIKGNCNAYNSSFCGVISVTINGVGIPNQTVSLNYSPLPVDLVDFYFYINNNIVTLTWTTAQEINNSHFNILKSNNGVDWEIIGTVEGNGNSYQTNTYLFLDTLSEKLNYYSIIQVDVDGKENHLGYKTVIINNTLINNEPLIYPNPFSDELKITLPLFNNPKTKIFILNLEGKIQGSEMSFTTNTESEIQLNTANLPSGIYFVKIINEDFVFVRKLVKE